MISVALGKKFCYLRRRPIVLLIFLDTILYGRQTLAYFQVTLALC